MILYYNQLTR